MNVSADLSYGDVIADRWFDLFKYMLYYVIGGSIVLSNSLIFLVVMRFSAMREKKEYIMLAALALADTVNGSAYFTAGVYRSYLILNGKDDVLVSPWDCMMKPHNWLFLIGETASAIMLTCVNLDRLVAVFYPMKYFQLTRAYTLTLIAPFYIFTLLNAAAAFVLSAQQEDIAKYRQICFTSYAYDNKVYGTFNSWTRTMGGICSVVIYAVILVKSRANAVRSTEKSALQLRAQESQQKMQRQMTVTIGISSAVTLILFVIPNALMIWVKAAVSGVLEDILVPVLMTCANLNAIANFFIYSMRHGDIRRAIRSLVTCKELR